MAILCIRRHRRTGALGWRNDAALDRTDQVPAARPRQNADDVPPAGHACRIASAEKSGCLRSFSDSNCFNVKIKHFRLLNTVAHEQLASVHIELTRKSKYRCWFYLTEVLKKV